jgi:hypothetical protein
MSGVSPNLPEFCFAANGWYRDTDKMTSEILIQSHRSTVVIGSAVQPKLLDSS